MSDLTTIRGRIEAQGFTCLTNDEVEDLNLWFRFAPAVCLLWVGAGVVLASPIILFALLPFALLGGILTGHPFDVVYNHGIRHLLRTPELPPYGRPRRFACLMASLMISATAAAFYSGYFALGYTIGAVMIVMASVQVATGICVPSFVHNLMFGHPLCEKDPDGTAQKKFESISPLWPK
ncbi:MAG TPA: DUF4395 family protein [Pyrinomonadaceae bacterium]